MMTPWAMPFAFYWFFPLLVWSLAWKGIALWHAARRGEVYWFVALFIVNTVGILEILYLYAFGGKEERNVSAGATPGAPPQ
ncbi:hypothetical protein A3I40_01885 [Candidatus Uhrbacteria bacterium RIFCSPLOWO2_02_FULL_48_12]|uniref:DUF5652 domain-containing protein n=1 Tax=Candidatus Uhrbacteria bacterium RIFCSPLOWO2_02_FULL_48_12 TaxID=1802407 RepID=A0A1F7V7R7_9BACT|nr:MAG: hypothetical protein A3I40_01885 [Candidatus Uhrbacteria bacterium RIFCSPLOWO2_02_FULL_48_12]